MNQSHRTGHSYRRPVIRITVANPVAHRLQGQINQLRREIKQAEATAARFGGEAMGVEGKREMLNKLEQQLNQLPNHERITR